MPADKVFRWVYDSRSIRYRDLKTGRYVSAKQVRDWADQALRASSDRVTTLGQMVSSDRITVTEWERMMREEIKKEYISQYLAGRGGIHKMTQADYGSIGGMIADQYRYLSGFARQLANGNLTEGQVIARSKMYTNSAREAYERAHERSAIEAGLEFVFWHTYPPAEHCEDCVVFEGYGWRRIDSNPYGNAFPGSGHTECLTSCKCWLEFASKIMG